MTTAHPTVNAKSKLQLPSTEIDFKPRELSSFSNKTVPQLLFASNDIVVGAGCVIIQPSTGLVVVLSRIDKVKDKDGNEYGHEYHFLPRGRKDIGERIDETAMREGYEESGYRCSLLPLNIPTHAPIGLEKGGKAKGPRYPNTEPFYIGLHHWEEPIEPAFPVPNGLQYLAHWFLGQIPHDAVCEENVGEERDKEFKATLVTFEEAYRRMSIPHPWRRDFTHKFILHRAWTLWEEHLEQLRNTSEKSAKLN